MLSTAAISGLVYLASEYYYSDELDAPEIAPAELNAISLKQLQNTSLTPQLKILVVGKHGIGKRTLVAELFGERQECSGDNQVYSSDTRCDQFSINGVSIEVFISDTPHLKSHHLKMLDLVLLAIRMDDTRYRGDDQEVLEVLTRRTGPSVWSRGMLALTFANKVTFLDEAGMERQSKEHLMRKARHWVNSVHGTLRNEGVAQAILSEVPAVPVGHPSKVQLYDDTESWKTALIKCMIVRLKESDVAASAAMWQVMKENIQLRKEESTIKCDW